MRYIVSNLVLFQIGFGQFFFNRFKVTVECRPVFRVLLVKSFFNLP